MAAKLYVEKDCKFMSINPAITDKMVDRYPELMDILRETEFPSSIDADAFFRYVAFIHDPESPLIAKHTDLKARKMVAASITGFNPKQEQPQAIVKFLMRINKAEWTVIASLERMFEEVVELVNEPIKKTDVDDKDILTSFDKKVKLKQEMKILPTEIRDAKRSFFGGDELLADAAAVIVRTPEQQQKALAKK